MPKATGKTKGYGCVPLIAGLLLVGFVGSVCNSTGDSERQVDSAASGARAVTQRVATSTLRPTRTIVRMRPTLGKVTTVRPGTAYPTPTKRASVTATQAPLGVGYVADVTIPDDTVFAPGASFEKTWRLRNTGRESWPDGAVLRWVANEQMGAPDEVTAPAAKPGAVVEVSVPMVAPEATGQHRGDWRICAGETCFGTAVYARIVTVVERSAPLPVLPEATEGPEPPTVAPAPPPAPPARTCCKICTTGKACGDTCISRSYTCRKGPGCACNAY